MGFRTQTSLARGVTPLGERARWHQRASLLYEELRQPATGLVRRAYGSAFSVEQIEDIYSSAWLGTLRALERRQSELTDDEVRSYLLAAVANHASKEIRRQRRKPVAPLEAAGAVADAAHTPEEIATSREAARVTRDVLSSLPPRRRAVMLLRYGWGLEPAEVCGMVKGLTPRAYRKEVTRGVDELAERIRLVEDGGWCRDREPVLKAYASGMADESQKLQAQHHLSHCRPCSEFVGKLTGHLHDVGSGLLVPGALEVDARVGALDRVKDAAEGVRETAAGILSRTDPADAVAVVTGARGAGAAGAGVAAKLTGLGVAGKATLACVSGGAAAAACVAAGIVPIAVGEQPDAAEDRAAIERIDERPPPVETPRPPLQPSNDLPGPPLGSKPAPAPGPPSPKPAPEPAPPAVLAPETPPTAGEFGVESGATPTASSGVGGGGGGDSGGGAVAQEFGP